MSRLCYTRSLVQDCFKISTDFPPILFRDIRKNVTDEDCWMMSEIVTAQYYNQIMNNIQLIQSCQFGRCYITQSCRLPEPILLTLKMCLLLRATNCLLHVVKQIEFMSHEGQRKWRILNIIYQYIGCFWVVQITGGLLRHCWKMPRPKHWFRALSECSLDETWVIKRLIF